MRIFDCFQFFDEDMMLDLRPNSLYSQVDKFIIVENLYMHSGKKKKKNFDMDKFKKFEKKIEYHFVEDFPKHNGDNYQYEHYQRNQIKRGFTGLEPNDIVLLSDADEIPNLKNKQFFMEGLEIHGLEAVFQY